MMIAERDRQADGGQRGVHGRTLAGDPRHGGPNAPRDAHAREGQAFCAPGEDSGSRLNLTGRTECLALPRVRVPWHVRPP